VPLGDDLVELVEELDGVDGFLLVIIPRCGRMALAVPRVLHCREGPVFLLEVVEIFPVSLTHPADDEVRLTSGFDYLEPDGFHLLSEGPHQKSSPENVR
jgi:hypothetical protein